MQDHDSTSSNLPTDRRALLAGLGGLAAGAFVAGRAKAGPLDPPAGPITSTGKTLTEVEPRTAITATNTPGDADSVFKITQPGSYYLTGNVTGEVGKHGIEIVVSGVTLDLNGFDLAGVPGMGDFDGILITAPSITNTSVRNGSVRDWGATASISASPSSLTARQSSTSKPAATPAMAFRPMRAA
jgi:hypothetical protein